MTLYKELKQVNKSEDIANHYSDLYVKYTEENVAIIKRKGYGYSIFRNEIDGERWIEIVGAYDPYWNAKRERRQ